uniref:RNA polymerase III subunit C4 n=1 Tax=Arcella intermedia TaxID=1963864 RepID=A0A6B2L7W3_9EUKA
MKPPIGRTSTPFNPIAFSPLPSTPQKEKVIFSPATSAAKPKTYKPKPSPKPQAPVSTPKPEVKPRRDVRQRMQIDTTKIPTTHLSSRASKKLKVYAKEDLAPTAIQMKIDPLESSHPITLPFLDPKKKENEFSIEKNFSTMGINEDDIEDDMYKAKTESTSKYSQRLIQTSYAENLFRNEEKQYKGDDELFFIQLPTNLPMKVQEAKPPAPAPAPTPNSNLVGTTPTPPPSTPAPPTPSTEPPATEFLEPKTNGFKNNLVQIPKGKIGKLYILKSGKVKLQIGDILYDVSQGMPLGFLQEVVAIDLKKGRMNMLGEVHKRMVVSPDIKTLLQSQQ